MHTVRKIEVKRIASQHTPQIRIRPSIGLRVSRALDGALLASGPRYAGRREGLPGGAYLSAE